MQTNPMKAASAGGRVQIGTWLNLMRNPAILTLMKSAGMDYARVDMEHSSPSMETVADMAMLGRALGLPVVVRPPEGNREWITRLLDMGVWGCTSRRWTTRPSRGRSWSGTVSPIGTRGQAGLGSHNDYAPTNGSEPIVRQRAGARHRDVRVGRGVHAH